MTNVVNIKELTGQSADDIMWEEYDTDVIPEVHVGDWSDEGKCQIQEVVFLFEAKYYRFYASRIGSYFSDYEYDFDDEATEVEKAERVVTYWKPVK